MEPAFSRSYVVMAERIKARLGRGGECDTARWNGNKTKAAFKSSDCDVADFFAFTPTNRKPLPCQSGYIKKPVYNIL
jgi:hypothetical protein